MIRISLVSLWARKRRLAGTALAVVLGVAFLTGTLVLGDTLSANFDRLFAEVSAGTDVVVRNETVIQADAGPDEARGPIDESLVGTVRDVDGVAAAEGQVVGYGALVGKDGDPVGGNGPPRTAGSWITDPDLNPYRLVDGRAPRTDDEVVVNRGAAKLAHLEVGDQATLQTPTPVDVTVVGIATFGDADGLGGVTFTAFTLEGAQKNVTREAGKVSTIVVKAAAGVSSNELRDRVTAALPDGTEAITGTDLADERTDAISQEFLDMVRTFLVVFAGIALVVATISISNTFTITVAQRTRELALLRAVGASRRQIRRSVTIEAVGVGVVASAIGVVAGLGVAAALKGVFDAFGFALPAGGMEIKPLSVAAGFVVGVVATFVAARTAARRAASLPPVAALRDTAAEPRSLSRRRTLVGAVVTAVGLALAVAGALTGALVPAGVGALVLLIGVLVVAPVALTPVAAGLGAVLRRTRGVNGMLAEENARRYPRRTAATATALVVGVAVVTLFTVFAASVKNMLEDQVTDDFGADLAVTTPVFGGGGLSPDVATELAGMDQIDTAVGLGGGPVRLDGETERVTAADAAELPKVLSIETVDGSLDDLGRDGIAVAADRADDEGWTIGSTVDLGFVDGASETATVKATYDDNRMVGSFLVPAELWAAHTAQPVDTAVLLRLSDGADVDQVRAAIEPLADRNGGSVEDKDEYAGSVSQGLDLLLGVVYVLLALAVVIALLGIGNTLSLAVYERRRELGLLRAVGQTRRQVRSVLRLESVIIATFGTLVGLALGGFLGWALFATVSDGVGSLGFPVVQLVVIAVLGALAGVLAARRPARRAAKLPILEAIASQ
ncbi:MAG TPA: FtsX-like permease family protein [Acidimicrobiales bacterium]|nr:FtsX-like permease family protein [Acidimicrobiales bacterium]